LNLEEMRTLYTRRLGPVVDCCGNGTISCSWTKDGEFLNGPC